MNSKQNTAECRYLNTLVLTLSTPDIFQTAIEPYHCTITDRPCSAREELREEELREGAKEGWKINTRTMELCPTYNSPENIVADLRDYLTMFKRN